VVLVGGQNREQFAHAVGAVDHDVGFVSDLRRPFIRADADADRGREPNENRV